MAGIMIFIVGLLILAALIIHFAPDSLQRIKVRP